MIAYEFRSHLPKECWIVEKHKYQLSDIVTDMATRLPYVELEHEDILKSNDIPYRKKDIIDSTTGKIASTVCEYWNPEYFEEKEINLPLFAKTSDKYFYCEKYYAEKRPTEETVKATKQTAEFVRKQIELVKSCQFAKNKLDGKVAVACISKETPAKDVYTVNINNDNFKMIRFFESRGYSDLVIIFDMNQIPENRIIELYAPKNIAGLVIGKRGYRIKKLLEIVEIVGVKRIHVVPF